MSGNEVRGNESRGISRRGFIKGTAAVGLGTAATAAGITPGGVPKAAAAEPAPMPPHGAQLRGLDLVAKSPTTEGRFGFMFKSQPPHGRRSDAAMLEAAWALTMEEQPSPPTPRHRAHQSRHQGPQRRLQREPQPGAHVRVHLRRPVRRPRHHLRHHAPQRAAVRSLRHHQLPHPPLRPRRHLRPGPRLGPAVLRPQRPDKFAFVETDTSTTKIGTDTASRRPSDVSTTCPDGAAATPTTGRRKAMIADPRNDQTLIILQLHVAMQMFHNKLVDYMRALGVPRAAVFESARRTGPVALPVDGDPRVPAGHRGQDHGRLGVQGSQDKAPIINLKYYKPTNSTGRPSSRSSSRWPHTASATASPGPATPSGTTSPADRHKARPVSSVPLFEAVLTCPLSADDNNLNGHRASAASAEDPVEQVLQRGPQRRRTARPVRQFDASLAGPLFNLPATALPDANPLSLLSQRNLLRGRKMGLPSGQQVARLMGVTPLTNAQLYAEPQHRGDDPDRHQRHRGGQTRWNVGEPEPQGGPSSRSELAGGEAPLWFYILKEAEHRVGEGRAARWALSAGASWPRSSSACCRRISTPICTCSPTGSPRARSRRHTGKFTMADLLKYADVWS